MIGQRFGGLFDAVGSMRTDRRPDGQMQRRAARSQQAEIDTLAQQRVLEDIFLCMILPADYVMGLQS